MRGERVGIGRVAGWSLTAVLSFALASPAAAQSVPQPRPSQLNQPAGATNDAAAALAGPAPVQAPVAPPPEPAPLRIAPSNTPNSAEALAQAVLTVDQEAIYRQSAWGRRAEQQIAEESRKVAADNDTAFAELVSDEDKLTAARATLSADEFRRRAAAFDERVTMVRQEREQARVDLARMIERDRALFFQAAAPVLGRIMESRNALVVLDQRTVLISADSIDVTAATVAALDSTLGDGSEIVAAAIEAEKRAAEQAQSQQEQTPTQPTPTANDLAGPSGGNPAPAEAVEPSATQGATP